MDEITAVAAAETISVLYNTEISLVARIPYSILKSLEEKALEYTEEVKLDMGIGLDKQNISEEAQTILSIIYKDYWCNNEKKAEMNQIFVEKEKEYDEELKASLDPFKDSVKPETIVKTSNEEKSLMVVQKKWYVRIFEKVMRFFRKK